MGCALLMSHQGSAPRTASRALRRAALFGALLALGGCFDEVPDPTQGFLQVRWGEASQVEVYVDDELVGVDPAVIGPIDAGTVTVRVARECYRTTPAGPVEVTIVPAKTSVVDFALELEDFGTVRVTAEDELTGDDIAGAAVFRETSPGVFTSTGLTTPALVDSVACGPARFRVAKPGYEDSGAVEVQVDTGAESTAPAVLGPLRGVLLEMFTYVVCPNCPYASDTLRVLRADLPEEAYAIEWHSGFSTLPLYDARWKAREVYYSAGTSIGYPSTTVAGELPFLVGGQTSDLSQYRPKSTTYLAECTNECALVIRLEGTIGASSAELVARIKWRGGSVPGSLVLRVVLIENDVLAPGNEPKGFDYVARTIAEQALVLGSPGEVQVVPVSLAIESWPYSGSPPEYEAVAFIQSNLTKQVVAVSGIR